MVSMLNTRRLFSSLGFLGTGIGAVMLVSSETRTSTTAWVTFASAVQACHSSGFKCTYGDLSTEYSGFLRGIGNTLGTASSFVVPLIAAQLLEQSGGSTERAAWQVVFSSSLLCGVSGAVMYSMWAS